MIKKYWKGYYSGSRLVPPIQGEDDEEKYQDFIENIQIDSFFSPEEYIQLKPGQTFNILGSHQRSKAAFKATVSIRGNIEDKDNILLKITEGEGEQKGKFLKGRLQGNVITGVWASKEEGIATQEDFGEGKFQIQYVECKKGWNGSFIQNGIQYNMTFHKLRIGHLSEEKAEEKGSSNMITGEGHDRKGKDFTIQGTFNDQTSTVSFVKKYKEGGAAITYKGQLDNKNEIVGHYKEKHPFSLYYI